MDFAATLIQPGGFFIPEGLAMGKARWIGEPQKCGHPGCKDKQEQPHDGFCPAHLRQYFAIRPPKRGNPPQAAR
ncbi:hypothetical protein [Noviherbaspirillum humi]|nr:hypothetical protein [Noviherbaspirillum humi]